MDRPHGPCSFQPVGDLHYLGDCGMETGKCQFINGERHSAFIDNISHRMQDINYKDHSYRSKQPHRSIISTKITNAGWLRHMGWLNLKQELQSDHNDTRNENEIYYQQSIDYHVDSVVY